MDEMEIFDAVAKKTGVRVKGDAPAFHWTTYRGGGVLARLYLPDGDGLAPFLRECAREGVSPFLLGGGSDTLIADGTVRRAAVSTRGARRVRVDGQTVTAQCGARIADIVRAGREAGLGGLEFLAGVPATAGGAVHMNAGAFGAEIGDYVVEIECLNPVSGETVVLKREEADFGYRRGVRLPVLGVTLRLDRMSAKESERRAEEYLAVRRGSQPLAPSCGSVFRRCVLSGATPLAQALLESLPDSAGAVVGAVTVSAGLLVERAGLKGVRCGGAMISPVHANFIVNAGGGTAADFLSLAKLAERRVRDLFGVTLQREFVLLE